MKTMLSELTSEEWDLIVEGVEQLKSKGFAGEIMETLLFGIIKPREGASDEEMRQYEENKRMREMERQFKEDEQKKVVKKLDVLKAKLILMQNQLSEEQK
jgi:hypothetical protein